MANWVRLWEDMPTDPKWRVIAKRAARPISEVMAVFMFMMTNAGANATERGALSNWSDEDVAAALDLEPEHIEAIRLAMQGKTLDGDHLSGWEKRQPKREDGAAERAKAFRERNRTQPNAVKRPEADAEAEAETERALLISDEISSGSLPPPHEIENQLAQATGWPKLRNVAAISEIVRSGVSLDARILPLARSVSAEFRERGEKPPKSWAYLAEVVNDPMREAKPPDKPVDVVFVVEGSPQWGQLCTLKPESYLRAISKTYGTGQNGVYWPVSDIPQQGAA